MQLFLAIEVIDVLLNLMIYFVFNNKISPLRVKLNTSQTVRYHRQAKEREI